ncbi:MAG: putative thiamine biosynthesis lipoprotein, partial [Nocardioidaceae bacterium]|nr:putative thiamine biosynthesis lipoprotein [Nocardioidaceae bacterium]
MDARDWTLWSCECRLVVTDPDALPEAATIVDALTGEVELAASRFRADSELRQLHDGWNDLSPRLADLIREALVHRPSDADSGMGILSGPSQRQRYFNLGSTTGAPVHGKTGFSIGIKPCHTLPRHGKPYAAGVLKRPTRRKSHAVVEHTKVEAVPVALCRDNHRAARGSPRNAMTNGILQQRLNDQAGHGRIFHLGGDLCLDPQVIPEADLLD